MLGKLLLVLSTVAFATAQIPSLGWCPEYVPMANFDINRFLGVWYEAERYFQLSEVVSRCVMANYTKAPDGKFRVSNEVTNRFTGIKRILEGEIKPVASKADEGKLHVKYSIPLTPETKYSVLETDYDNYAVLWSCSGIGPLHAQNAWLMTRQRLAPGEVLQKAYGVLDKYKISKTFFVKTDQDACAYSEPEPPKATSENAAQSKPKPKPEPGTEAAAPAEEQQQQDEAVRSASVIPQVEPVAVQEPHEQVASKVETVPEGVIRAGQTADEEKIPVAVQQEEASNEANKEEKKTA